MVYVILSLFLETTYHERTRVIKVWLWLIILFWRYFEENYGFWSLLNNTICDQSLVMFKWFATFILIFIQVLKSLNFHLLIHTWGPLYVTWFLLCFNFNLSFLKRWCQILWYFIMRIKFKIYFQRLFLHLTFILNSFDGSIFW